MHPTAPPLDEGRFQRRELVLRRVFVAALSLFLLAAAVGAFGVRTVEKSASGDGFDLTVTYARVTRPGLATPWSLEVASADGEPITEPIVIEVDPAYFDLFDENGLDPDPAAATATDRALRWEFDPPDAPVFNVSFDARIEPAAQWGRPGWARVVDDEGTVVAEIRWRTTVMP